ncbi:hypothetical protein RJ641_032661 [Dillenia turbinata]|uniref:ABC1 atypical kinase-like domain-containing protein n=1 Tax=Dillenia turbinata TaxID=194707 RepID=A0AAN8ZM10_9MAGN
MATSPVSLSSIVGNPLSTNLKNYCKPRRGRGRGRARARTRARARVTLRAALVEVESSTRPLPAAVLDATGDGGGTAAAEAAAVLGRDRTNDMQAEARAMARAANASIYSPQLLALKYGFRPLKVLWRALEIFAGLSTFAFKLLLDQRNGVLDQNKRRRAAELRNTFTRLGPTFVKIGQGLSTRPDICPPDIWRSSLSFRMHCLHSPMLRHFYALKENWNYHLIPFFNPYLLLQ